MDSHRSKKKKERQVLWIQHLWVVGGRPVSFLAVGIEASEGGVPPYPVRQVLRLPMVELRGLPTEQTIPNPRGPKLTPMSDRRGRERTEGEGR